MKRKVEKIIVSVLDKGWLIELFLDNQKCKRFACNYKYEINDLIDDEEYEDGDDEIPF